VGNVTFFYPPIIMNFPRTYCYGFALPVGCAGSALTGGNLVTTYTPINQFLQLKLNPAFLAATSNKYSLDYVFDLAECYSYIDGVLSPGTIAVEFGTYAPERVYRFRLGVGLAVDPLQNVDLPQLPNYWRANP
jgi:hypothetical protein